MSFPKSEVEQPPRHLRGYEKPYLKAGERKTVEFRLVGRVKQCLTESD
jgi:hypothetical protein